MMGQSRQTELNAAAICLFSLSACPGKSSSAESKKGIKGKNYSPPDVFAKLTKLGFLPVQKLPQLKS